MDALDDKSCKKCPLDNPTWLAHPGTRFFITLISWFLLSNASSYPGPGFFITLTMFSFNLLSEYMKFKVTQGYRIYIQKAGVFLSATWLMIGILGMANVFLIEQIDSVIYLKLTSSGNMFKEIIVDNFQTDIIKLRYLWMTVGLSVLGTGLDWTQMKYMGTEEIKEEFSKDDNRINSSENAAATSTTPRS